MIINVTIVFSAPKCMIGFRHLIVVLLFFATFVGYASRVVLSVAIVAMLKKDSEFPHFDWDEQGVEGLVLSSFFWGSANDLSSPRLEKS